MRKLTTEEKEKIKQAVSQSEKKTSGEFVTVIARKSDDYIHIPFLWASVLSLLVPPVLMYFFNHYDSDFIFKVQAITFIVMFSLLQIDFLKILLVPRKVKELRSKRNAFLQFYAQGVSSTKNRSGILLFVSQAEKYVEIIADEGINKKVSQEYWESIITRFISNVKKGEITEGFISAITECNDLLSREFPVEKDDTNELSDRLIEI